jgi:hypothetical protein
MTRRLSKVLAKSRSKPKRIKRCLLLLLPVELFSKITNELNFIQKLEMALDTTYFGFMFMLPELWSISPPPLSLGNVEVKTSSHKPKRFLSTLESSIPKNSIRTVSIDTSFDSLFWSTDHILDLIRILLEFFYLF